MLNAAGLTTGKGKPFTAGGVARVRDAYKIFGPRTVAVQAGEVSAKQAAAELGITADAVYNWLRLGQVPARRGPSGRWCIPWDAAAREIYQQRSPARFVSSRCRLRSRPGPDGDRTEQMPWISRRGGTRSAEKPPTLRQQESVGTTRVVAASA